MNHPGFDPDIVKSASKAQAAAADPAANVFVEASAGSGKTRVLVDRVARLLLADARPDRILCVTFTKAAAGEMQARLFHKLGEWSILPDDALTRELETVIAPDATPDLGQARRLFARALETPGGLKIQTLHAFCKNLLRRFPLEAGLPPGFEVQDDAAARELQAETIEALSAQAQAQSGGEIAQAIATLIDAAGVEAPERLSGFSMARRHEFRAALARAGSPHALQDEASRLLDVPAGLDKNQVLEDAWAETDVSALQAALSAASSKADNRIENHAGNRIEKFIIAYNLRRTTTSRAAATSNTTQSAGIQVLKTKKRSSTSTSEKPRTSLETSRRYD